MTEENDKCLVAANSSSGCTQRALTGGGGSWKQRSCCKAPEAEG